MPTPVRLLVPPHQFFHAKMGWQVRLGQTKTGQEGHNLKSVRNDLYVRNHGKVPILTLQVRMYMGYDNWRNLMQQFKLHEEELHL